MAKRFTQKEYYDINEAIENYKFFTQFFEDVRLEKITTSWGDVLYVVSYR